MSGILDAIGNTPVIRLQRLVEPGMAEVWVKLEAGNPTGSYKDRGIVHAVLEAERTGRLAPGQPVVEFTGGSTGAALALACGQTGHPLFIVAHELVAPEKVLQMRALGATVEVLPAPDGVGPQLTAALRARVDALVAEHGAWWNDQFGNPDVPEGYRPLGRELSAQLGRVDAFCTFLGSAGCYLGATRGLRESQPDVLRVVVEPAESPVFGGGGPGSHGIEGGGMGVIPAQVGPDDWDEAIAVSTEEAFAMARRAAREEGVFSGGSTGANLVAALELARRLGEGKRVATVQVDSGLKYLGGAIYRAPRGE